MNLKKLSKKMNKLIVECHAQALTEYLLVTVVIGLALAGVLVLMKWPIAHYLKNIMGVIAETR